MVKLDKERMAALYATDFKAISERYMQKILSIVRKKSNNFIRNSVDFARVFAGFFPPTETIYRFGTLVTTI